MRKLLFVLALLYGTTLIAQNKAVAVTEVVDKEDKVSYATEIMVRTRLTAAISMKQGYTAYDRVDLQSIMKEQDFQRTGLVDDATIKRLGEMTGASLILIPEVAMGDDGKIYVAVKMLDVTTARTLMSTGELMGSSSAEVEEGCRALTARILGIRSNSSDSSAVPDKPITLFGYLHVFPTDIGEFQNLPAQLLSAINNKATYGYDSWRLPTTEELSIMRANSHMIPGFKNAEYLCSDSSTKGLARLVTTDMTAAEKIKVKEQEKEQEKERDKQIRKKAIFNLLDIHGDFEQYMILDTIVVCCVRGRYALDSDGNIIRPSHSNPKFKLRESEYLRNRYMEYLTLNDANNYALVEGIVHYAYVGRIDWKNRKEGYRNVHVIYQTRSNWHSDTYLRFTTNQHVMLDKTGKRTYDEKYMCTRYALFVAYLPPEYAIIQEMRKIKENNTPIDSY